jgi:hypothetical protein
MRYAYFNTIGRVDSAHNNDAVAVVPAGASITYTVGASGRGREPRGELIICNFKPTA